MASTAAGRPRGRGRDEDARARVRSRAVPAHAEARAPACDSRGASPCRLCGARHAPLDAPGARRLGVRGARDGKSPAFDPRARSARPDRRPKRRSARDERRRDVPRSLPVGATEAECGASPRDRGARAHHARARSTILTRITEAARRTTRSTRSSSSRGGGAARDVPPGAGEPVPRRQPRPELRAPVPAWRPCRAALRRRRAGLAPTS